MAVINTTTKLVYELEILKTGITTEVYSIIAGTINGLSLNLRHFNKLPFFSNFCKFATGAIGSPSLFLRIGPASNCNSSLGTNDKWNVSSLSLMVRYSQLVL